MMDVTSAGYFFLLGSAFQLKMALFLGCKRAIVPPNPAWSQHQIVELACTKSLNDSDLAVCVFQNHSLNLGSWDILFCFRHYGPIHEPVFTSCLRVLFQGLEMAFKLQLYSSSLTLALSMFLPCLTFLHSIHYLLTHYILAVDCLSLLESMLHQGTDFCLLWSLLYPPFSVYVDAQ